MILGGPKRPPGRPGPDLLAPSVARSRGNEADCRDPDLRALLTRIEGDRTRQRSRLRRRALELELGIAPRTEPAPEQAPAALAAAGPATTPADGALQVTELDRPTADLIRLRVPRPKDLTFLPGQALRLGSDGISRRYTLASAPEEPFLEFFIRLVPGGRMSAYLATLQQGGTVYLRSAPKGGLTLDGSRSQHLMVATGTGINPFVSMLRHHLPRGLTGRVVLLNGASYQDELAYREELAALEQAHPNLVYIPTVSRPDDPRNRGWSGETGRVDQLLPGVLEAAGLNPGATAGYVCGNPAMVDTVAGLLKARGLPVRTERYD